MTYRSKIAALAAACVAGAVTAQTTPVPIQGPPEAPGGPSWYLQNTAADPEGLIPLERQTGKGELGTSSYGRKMLGDRFGKTGRNGMPPQPGEPGGTPLPGAPRERGEGGGGMSGGASCQKSPICIFDGTVMGGIADGIERVVWKPNLGYTFAYPIELPGKGNVAAASVDSKDNIWVYQRNVAPLPALMKYGPDYKLLLGVDPKLTNNVAPFNAHDMKVDDEDNVWTADMAGSIVQKFSPEGKLLLTLGTKGRPGDWDEEKGQRLIWQPVAIDFGPTGDVYIFCGHADESPNDIGTSEENKIGLSRVIRVTKDGKFISQWFGSDNGPGKFYSAHGGAVDPTNGDVWVGDRQNYRAVVFNADGHFLRTVSMRNLTSAFFFDRRRSAKTFGQLWLATGQDGQVLRIDKATGKVTGAIGTRKGQAPAHFSEAAFMGLNSKGRFYVGDSQVARVTELIPPSR